MVQLGRIILRHVINYTAARDQLHHSCHTSSECHSLAWHQAPSPSGNRIAGAALGRGSGLASALFTGKRKALVLDFNNCQLSVINVNKKTTD